MYNLIQHEKFRRAFVISITSLANIIFQFLLVLSWTRVVKVEVHANYITLIATVNLLGAINKPAISTIAEKYGASLDFGGLKGAIFAKIKHMLLLSPIFIFILLFTGDHSFLMILISLVALIVMTGKGLILSFSIGSQRILPFAFISTTPSFLTLILISYYGETLTITSIPFLIIFVNLVAVIPLFKNIIQANLLKLSDDDAIFEKSASKALSLNILLKADRIIIKYLLGDLAVVSYQVCVSCMQLVAGIQALVIKFFTPFVVRSFRLRELIQTKYLTWSGLYFLSAMLVGILIWIIWYDIFLYFFPSFGEIVLYSYVFFLVSLFTIPSALIFNVRRLVSDATSVNQYTHANIWPKFLGLATCNVFELTGIMLGYILAAILTFGISLKMRKRTVL